MTGEIADAELAQQIARWQHGSSFELTELGNAERLVATHGRDVRYVSELGWFVWAGDRWRPDTDGELVRRMSATVRLMYAEAADLADADDRKRLVSHARKSESKRALDAAVALAAVQPEVIARLDILDADPWILNVANGVLHLAADEFEPHDRDLLLTKLCPVSYRPDAMCPRWLAFLEAIFAGDRDLIQFVQRAVGYSLTGSTREQVMFVLHGTGANGKTTFLETIRALLGDYAQQAPPELFLEQRPGGPRPDLARLPGARLVTAVETGEGRRLAEPLVKQLTGGDMIATRRLYRDVFEFRPAFKPWLATNHRPETSGNDDAIWRRLREIPFNVTIPAEERDPELVGKLRTELPGILNWALDGCRDWQRAGTLGDPDAVTAATRDYRAQMDVIARFLDERCDLLRDATAKASALFAAFDRWATDTGEPHTLTQRKLTEELQRRSVTLGIEYGRDRTIGRHFRGIAVRPESRNP